MRGVPLCRLRNIIFFICHRTITCVLLKRRRFRTVFLLRFIFSCEQCSIPYYWRSLPLNWVLSLQWSNLRLGFKIAWLSFRKIYILTASFRENSLHLLSRHKFASNHKLAQSILRRKFFSMYKPSWFCSANFPPYINPSKYGLWKIFAVLTSYVQSCTK